MDNEQKGTASEDQGTQYPTMASQPDKTVNASKEMSTQKESSQGTNENDQKKPEGSDYVTQVAAERGKYASLEKDNAELKRKVQELAQAKEALSRLDQVYNADPDAYKALQKAIKKLNGEIEEVVEPSKEESKKESQKESQFDPKEMERLIDERASKKTREELAKEKFTSEWGQGIAKFNEKFSEFDPKNVKPEEAQDKQRQWLSIYEDAIRFKQKRPGLSTAEALEEAYYFQPEYRDKLYDRYKTGAGIAKKAGDLANAASSENTVAGSQGTGSSDDSLTEDDLQAIKAAGVTKESYLRMKGKSIFA